MENFNQVINSDLPVLVDFHADWCGPCQTMNPLIKELAGRVQGKARILKINIDKNQATANQYNVDSVPTFIIFKNGEAVWRHSGTIDAASLERRLSALY